MPGWGEGPDWILRRCLWIFFRCEWQYIGQISKEKADRARGPHPPEATAA